MEITSENINDITVLNFSGSLDTSTAPQAEEQVNPFLSDDAKIIIDLSGTNYVSSAGLRVFLATAKRLGAVNGSLCICNANEVVKEILEISGFTTILDVQDSLEEAKTALS